MPLFSFGNYSKPGPGVQKDEPQKSAPIRFFEIYGRKFTKLVQLNLLFFVAFLVAAVLAFLLYLSPTHFMMTLPSGDSVMTLDIWTLYVVPLPVILLAPFTAGLTTVTRNFVREEHAFVWYDFRQSVQKNWKAFLLNGILFYVVYVILSFALIYYVNAAKENPFFYVAFWFCFVLALLFLFAQYYVPIMLVSFDLTLRQVYRNAAVFILAGLFRNILITVILIALIILFFGVIPVMPLTILLFIVLAAVWAFSFVSYLINFIIYPVVDQYLFQPAKQRMEAEYDARADRSRSLKEEELPERDYVFVNGKMVKRSELKPGEAPEE